MSQDIKDSALGRLAWNDEFSWWIAELELYPGHKIEVIIDYSEEFHEGVDTQEARLAQAREWLARVRQREPEYRSWTAKQLLTARWNSDEAMTRDDIEELLRLLSIECASDGSARLYWNDDDVLFYGHGIFTQLGTSGECIRTRML